MRIIMCDQCRRKRLAEWQERMRSLLCDHAFDPSCLHCIDTMKWRALEAIKKIDGPDAGKVYRSPRAVRQSSVTDTEG